MNMRTLGWLLIFVGFVLGVFAIAIIKESAHDYDYRGPVTGIVMLLAAVCALVCGISVLRKHPKE